jgi:cytochrome c nitrite reductase small subunit
MSWLWSRLAGFGGLLQQLRPPRSWNLAVLLASGMFCGLLALTLHVSRATSYLTNDPAACVNCHIMAPQYASWQHSSHGRFTTCNDCHVPQDTVRKYAFKAYDGSRHAFMFTFKLEPQVIRIHGPGARVVQENCVRCHSNLLAAVGPSGNPVHGDGRSCVDCHRDVPHGRVNSLASAPHAQVPQPSPVRMPAWVADLIANPPPPPSPAPAKHP